MIPDRIHGLGATVTQPPAPDDLPSRVSRIARLCAELALADPGLAAELARKLPTMDIIDGR